MVGSGVRDGILARWGCEGKAIDLKGFWVDSRIRCEMTVLSQTRDDNAKSSLDYILARRG
jgi:hypothetical protein